MKKTFISLSILTLLFVGCAPESPNSFTLSGKIEGKTDGVIYLDRYDMSTMARQTDTIKIKNGSFVFKGTIDEPASVVLSDGNVEDFNNPNLASFYIEPAKMNISLVWNNFKEYKLTGSVTNEEALAYEQMLKPISERAREIHKSIGEEKDTAKLSELEAQMEKLSGESEAMTMDFIKSHPDSYFAATMLSFNMSKMKLEELQASFNNFTERIKISKAAKGIVDEINKLTALTPGNLAPVFSAIDINGNQLSLSDFKGKYVILDFWASWCVPCRKSNPHLKAMYEKYKDKGLEVICISDDDSSPDKWREAVAKDKIEMFHHVLRGLKTLPDHSFDRTNDLSEAYAVHYLPTKYLIDREGNMVGKVTSEELEAKLKEIFE